VVFTADHPEVFIFSFLLLVFIEDGLYWAQLKRWAQKIHN